MPIFSGEAVKGECWRLGSPVTLLYRGGTDALALGIVFTFHIVSHALVLHSTAVRSMGNAFMMITFASYILEYLGNCGARLIGHEGVTTAPGYPHNLRCPPGCVPLWTPLGIKTREEIQNTVDIFLATVVHA